MSRSPLLVAALALAASCLAAVRADAQQNRPRVSFGVAAGVGIPRYGQTCPLYECGSVWESVTEGGHAIAVAEVGADSAAVRFRLDGMLVSFPQDHGPFSLTGNLVLPLRRARLAPYLIGGAGVYGVGGVGPAFGWNGGGGLRYRVGRTAALFAEARAHTATREMLSAGIIF